MPLLTPQIEPALLYQGDDEAELLDLRMAWEIAAQAAEAETSPLRVGDESPGAAVEEKRDAYMAKLREAAGRALEVHVAPIGSARFAALVAKHPARTDDEGDVVLADARHGVNTATLPRELLLFRDERKRTIVAPDLDDDALVEFIDDDCTDGHVEKLFDAAFWLNRSRGSDLPKALESSTDFPRSTGS